MYGNKCQGSRNGKQNSDKKSISDHNGSLKIGISFKSVHLFLYIINLSN